MLSRIITYSLFVLVCISMSCTGSTEQTKENVPTTIGLTSIQKLDRQIEANPDKPSLYMQRGDLYFELEGYDEAIADYKKVIELDKDKVDAHVRLAETYLAYDNSRLALRTMEAASFQFRDNMDLMHKLAEYQIILKQNNEAFKTLQRATKLDRFDPKTFYLMGVNFQDVDDEEKAIRSYKLAVEKDPDFVDALMRLGFIYQEKEDPIALKYYDNAIAADPDLFDAYMAKGNYLGMQGKFPEAIDVFQEITARSGKRNPSAFFNIGLAYFQMDSLAQAGKHFKIASDLDQTYGLAYYYQGVVAEKEGDIEAAKKNYNQATSFEASRARAEQALEGLK